MQAVLSRASTDARRSLLFLKEGRRMPEAAPLATYTVTAEEQPTEAVAAQKDDAADAVAEAAVGAADAGQDGLAKQLHDLEVTLRGELQHHVAEDHKKPEAVIETVETDVPETVVKPTKLHWYQRTMGL